MDTENQNHAISAKAGLTGADREAVMQVAREHAQKMLKRLPMLGPVTWLMMAGAATRHTLLSELEWRVMPPLMLGQAKLYLREETPVAFASWARLSAAAAERYRMAPHHLAPTDWNSGEQLWLVDVLVPYGGAQDVLKDLRENALAGEVLHQLLPVGESVRVLSWPAVDRTAAV